MYIVCSGHCNFHLSSITLHMGVTLKSSYLFVVGAMPFAVNQNVKCESFHSKLFSGSVLVETIGEKYNSYIPHIPQGDHVRYKCTNQI